MGVQVYRCTSIWVYRYVQLACVRMGARRGGQEGALAPPWKFTDMGAPPPKDNLTRHFFKKIKGTPYSKRRN